MKPLSLYLHLPFCKKKCFYCDFLSFQSNEEEQNVYIKGLINEIKGYKGIKEEYSIKSIFLGGGTPSVISKEHIRMVFEEIKRNFTLDKNIEITIEVNPGTVDVEKLITYKEIGINRLSIGLQSTDNEFLQKLGRIHNYEKFLDTYNMAREVGYNNISIDLIFGLPELTLEKWEKTLRTVIDKNPEHISCYSLIIEEGTPFHKLYESGDIDYLNEDIEREMYRVTKNILEKNNYFQYEVSNYAKKNHESYHNCVYWTGKEYLGLGLGAASYMNQVRYKNTDNMKDYINYSNKPSAIRVEESVLSEQDLMEEFMFLGLRLIKGVSKEDFRIRFNIFIEDVYGDVILELEKKALINNDKDKIQLTAKGIDLSNYVLSEFLL
ncbi:oxygen-independent coproporphyrinogen-3 oxidase [Natranaerovirga pectinivora]|uniref:Heme chaperone HemW n=1 Tax=Natranaerovirga pectinivora TaxID=682400 RepID=A0A4R3MNS4_9FIRM|nr:radical SAM family heme chaperone HemW [Natranaerovirga pectinivora]TCT16871.1 oxygen-independent coproporphyrinogen-3 oxidase [Natranaerovirga pectinivora]